MSLMKIKDFFHFEKGSLQSSKCTPGKYDFITASSEWKTHNEYTHDCEALIFAAAASGSLGRIHYVHGKFVASDLCFVITPKDSINYPIDLKFYHLIFQAFKDEIVRNTKAGTSKEAIGLTAFGKYELPYFGIDKQREVKEKFVKAQELTFGLDTELTHQLSLVKQLRQAFLGDAMQGKLVPQDANDEPASVLLEKIKAEKEKLIKEKKIKKDKPLPPISEDEVPLEIPENWVWCRLGELVLNFQNGISSRGASTGDKITVLRLADITNNIVDLSDRREIVLQRKDYERYLLDENDILITRVNGSLDLVGNFNYVGKHNIPIAACDHFVRMTLAKEIDSSFVFLSGKMNHLRRNIEDNFKTTSGQKTVNQGHLSALLIALPPYFEQQRIVSKLDELMKTCDNLEASIKQSQQQNEALLQQVLREALER